MQQALTSLSTAVSFLKLLKQCSGTSGWHKPKPHIHEHTVPTLATGHLAGLPVCWVISSFCLSAQRVFGLCSVLSLGRDEEETRSQLPDFNQSFNLLLTCVDADLFSLSSVEPLEDSQKRIACLLMVTSGHNEAEIRDQCGIKGWKTGLGQEGCWFSLRAGIKFLT